MKDDIEAATDQHARGGIQALDTALVVLKGLAMFDGPVTLTDLARAVGMPSSKIHRYLASFIHAGFAQQTERSGRYQLGPFAAAMGVAALSQSDFVNQAADALPDLGERTGLTALLSVWSRQGAMVVRWYRAPSPLVTSFGLGSSLPLLTSASGRVFLAYLPTRMTEARTALEMEHAHETGASWPGLQLTGAGVEALVADIREKGFASVDGQFVPGLRAVAAPILNWQGEAEAAVTLISTSDSVLRPDGAAVQALGDFVRSLSSQKVWAPDKA